MAARDSSIDAWMNRYRAFAEGVVIMVCPVHLAIALKKVDLKRQEHGRAVPIIMLVVATGTLIAGICPFLVCCFLKRRCSPLTATKWLALLSTTCLMALACWIIRLILDIWAYPVVGAVIGLCVVIPMAKYCHGNNDHQNAAAGDKEFCSKLENSLDFSAGITALLFLGLEGLALEGQINSTRNIQHLLTNPIGVCFLACVVGVCLVLMEMIPRKITSNITEIFDLLMALSVSVAMFFIMYSLMKLRALLLIAAPFLILMMHVFHAAISANAANSINNDSTANPDEERGTAGSSGRSGADGDKPASLELTKVTFTGFLAVSIPNISNGSLNMITECFLHLAATAIVSGLVWRLLTHYKSHTTIKPIANIASFCTHLSVAIATIPFAIMAGKVLS